MLSKIQSPTGKDVSLTPLRFVSNSSCLKLLPIALHSRHPDIEILTCFYFPEIIGSNKTDWHEWYLQGVRFHAIWTVLKEHLLLIVTINRGCQFCNYHEHGGLQYLGIVCICGFHCCFVKRFLIGIGSVTIVTSNAIVRIFFRYTIINIHKLI